MSGIGVLVSLDKFRGSMTAHEACAALASGISAVSDCPVEECPVADGGEGTVEALIDAGYERVVVDVVGPNGQRVAANLAIMGLRAVVELAQAAGIQLSEGNSALTASTYGAGQLIGAALDRGCNEIVLAMGGTATTDGGAGMLRALGAHFLDSSGTELRLGGGDLVNLSSVDLSRLDPRLHSASLIVASDVTNPLLGPGGAAAVYGPQKGADRAAITLLEAGLDSFSRLLEAATGRLVAEQPGAGAAGGAGFAALALGAHVESGVGFVLNEICLTEKLGAAELVVVGEGAIDQQSLQGKAPIGISTLARGHGVPVVAVAGQINVSLDELTSVGIVGAHDLLSLAGSLVRSMSDAPELLRQIGERIAAEYLAAV